MNLVVSGIPHSWTKAWICTKLIPISSIPFTQQCYIGIRSDLFGVIPNQNTLALLWGYLCIFWCVVALRLVTWSAKYLRLIAINSKLLSYSMCGLKVVQNMPVYQCCSYLCVLMLACLRLGTIAQSRQLLHLLYVCHACWSVGRILVIEADSMFTQGYPGPGAGRFYTW